jgi:hypothetical protein
MEENGINQSYGIEEITRLTPKNVSFQGQEWETCR